MSAIDQEKMNLYDSAKRIAKVNLKITIYDGQFSTESMNHSIHRILSDRKFLAQKIVERGLYENVDAEVELLKRYNEEIKRVLDL